MMRAAHSAALRGRDRLSRMSFRSRSSTDRRRQKVATVLGVSGSVAGSSRYGTNNRQASAERARLARFCSSWAISARAGRHTPVRTTYSLSESNAAA